MNREGGASGRTDCRDLWVQSLSFGDLLLRAAERDPDFDAVIFPGERQTWTQLADRAREIAKGLSALGVRLGDRVGILMPNSPDVIASLFGIALAGGVLVPINTRYRAVELPFVIRDAGVRAILTTDRIDHYIDLAALLEEALPGLPEAASPSHLELADAPGLRSVIRLGGPDRAGILAESAFLELSTTVKEAEFEHRRGAVRLSDISLLLYTSGQLRNLEDADSRTRPSCATGSQWAGCSTSGSEIAAGFPVRCFTWRASAR